MQWRVCRQQALTEGSFPGGSSHRLVPFDPCNVLPGAKRERHQTRDVQSATPTTTRWPSRSSARSRQSSSADKVPGGAATAWRWPRWSRSTGTTTAACSRPWAISHPPRQNRPTGPQTPRPKPSDGITHPPLNPGRFNSPKRASVDTYQVRVLGPHPGQVLASHDRRSDPALARVGQDAKDLPGQHVVPIRTRLGDL